jgi:nitroreductase
MIDARALFEEAERRELVTEANLAPSVHNIQPARFHFAEDGAIQVVEHAARRIPVGDPTGADNRKSLGAAAEGLSLALAARNLTARIEIADGLRLTLNPEAAPDPLREYVPARATWRGHFARPSVHDARALDALAKFEDLTIVTEAGRRAEIAALYDETSLSVLRDDAYREELVAWMRLARRHPDWSRDGLNADAMALSPFEAFGAGVVMGNAFKTLDKLGIAGPLIAEGAKVKGAAGVIFFHRPQEENDYDTGRRFYRVWLEMTARGLAACPMSVLADVGTTATAIKTAYGIPADRKLVTAFRVGCAPDGARRASRARLPVDELVV